MGRLPRDLEAKGLRLIGAVRRGAFESYMRHGRVPEAYAHIAAAVSEAKALNTDVSLGASSPVRPVGRPTTHYVWRTAGDNRVRGAHAARDGQIFAWGDPPEHGHPGREPNCRCWPEPHYGDPAVPDALAMVPGRRVNTDPGVLWASIDTTTRPDGSLAASSVVLNDGTVIHSTFAATSVDQLIKPRHGQDVLVFQRRGAHAIQVGHEASPTVESTWRRAPVVIRTRVRSAFQEPLDPLAPRHLIYSEPGGSGDLGSGAGGGVLAAVLALLDLYNQRNADPVSQGGVDGDTSFIAFRDWQEGIDPQASPGDCGLCGGQVRCRSFLHHRSKTNPVTTAVEIKRWTRQLVDVREDVVLQGRRLTLTPIHHIFRSIFFEGSSDRTDPRALWSFKLPFVPKGLTVGLWSGYVLIGHSTDAGFLDRVFEQFTQKIDQDLKPVSTIEAFYEMTLEYRPHEAMTGLWQLSRQPEYHACVLAALGRLEDACAVAERCIEPMDKVRAIIEKGQASLAKRANSSDGGHLLSVATRSLAILTELERLTDLARAGDRVGVAALLHEWELQRIRLWEVEDLWEPTPFPIELGAGD